MTVNLQSSFNVSPVTELLDGDRTGSQRPGGDVRTSEVLSQMIWRCFVCCDLLARELVTWIIVLTAFHADWRVFKLLLAVSGAAYSI